MWSVGVILLLFEIPIPLKNYFCNSTAIVYNILLHCKSWPSDKSVQGISLSPLLSYKELRHIHFRKHSKSLEGCLTVHLPHEITWNANLMQLGNFIDLFLARHVSGTYAHHQEHWMLSCTIRTAHTTYAAALKTTTHPKTRCRKPYAATQQPMLLMMGVCTRNMST